MTVRSGGCEVSGHGVLDVAVDLLHRGRGAAPALIARILADARKNGSAVSLAHPSAPALYRGLGYEAVACLELRRLNRTVVEGATADPGVRLRDGVIEEVLGSLSRHLEGACSPAPPAVEGVRDVVLDRDGQAVGMLRLERLAGRVVVHLLRVADTGAWATALVVLRAEAAQEAGESCIEVWGGGDDDLALWHPGRLRVRECSMPMLRVVDVVRALEERGWPADVAGRWCFDIADPLIPVKPLGNFPTLDAIRPIESCGTVITLEDGLLFDFGSFQVREDSAETISDLSALLKEAGAPTAHIYGHTDSVSDDAFNQTLSEQRAQAVVEALKANGVSTSLDATGFGETRPVAPNENSDGSDNPAGRQLNRRVEIFIPVF